VKLRSSRLPPLPAVPERFPAPFRALLHEVLARGPRLPGDRQDRLRARRSALSQSGTFVGHRPYVRGDDLRRIDWAAFARSGEMFTKQLEEEERRTATLLIDPSPRLLVGNPPRRLAALRLASVIGGLALRHLDALTVLVPGAGARTTAVFQGGPDLDRLLQHLDELPVVAAEPADAIALVLQRPAFGRVHWISDFADPATCEPALGALRRAGGKVTGWLPAIDEDARAPQRGYVRVADPASGESFAVAIDRALAAELQRQLESLRRRQERLFAQCGCPLVRWRAPAADDCSWSAYQEIVVQCSR